MLPYVIWNSVLEIIRVLTLNIKVGKLQHNLILYYGYKTYVLLL
jgi:hypothetical protein